MRLTNRTFPPVQPLWPIVALCAGTIKDKPGPADLGTRGEGLASTLAVRRGDLLQRLRDDIGQSQKYHLYR